MLGCTSARRVETYSGGHGFETRRFHPLWGRSSVGRAPVCSATAPCRIQILGAAQIQPAPFGRRPSPPASLGQPAGKVERPAGAVGSDLADDPVSQRAVDGVMDVATVHTVHGSVNAEVPFVTLAELLVALFSTSELRRFVATLPQGQEILNSVAGQGAADYAFEIAAALARHGLVDDALFDRLVSERPSRERDIQATQTRTAPALSSYVHVHSDLLDRSIRVPFDPDEPAGALLDRVKQVLEAPEDWGHNDRIRVVFTYSLQAAGTPLGRRERLGERGVRSGDDLDFVTEMRTETAVAPLRRTRNRAQFRGDRANVREGDVLHQARRWLAERLRSRGSDLRG